MTPTFLTRNTCENKSNQCNFYTLVDILEFAIVQTLQWERCISPNDPKVIKVSSAALGAKRLLEGENHRGHAGPVPYGSKDAISKPTNQQHKIVFTLQKSIFDQRVVGQDVTSEPSGSGPSPCPGSGLYGRADPL